MPAGSLTLAARYDALVRRGELVADPAQYALTDRFDRLNAALAERRLAQKGSALGWLFAGKREAVIGFLASFGLNRTEAEEVLTTVGTAP